MKIKIIFHLAFWCVFILFFWQQNPTATLQEYIPWLTILSVCAVVVYANLYFLFPKYFFQKKYLTYSIFLLLIVGLGAFSLKLIFSTGNASFALPVFQHFTNLFFFVVVTSSLKFMREFLKKQSQLIEIENKQLKTELSLLKSQINPHFLFNTLNNLYGLIIQYQNEEAGDITLKLSNLMRYLLLSSNIEQISLLKEIKFVEDYLTLEKIRLAQNVDIRFEISSLEKDVFIAPLLFIPLVENAFKHGLQTITDNSFAHFSLSLQSNELYFEAKNSVGKIVSSEEKSGTGLKNLRQRLLLVYPQKHRLEIEHNKEIFKVILQINI